MRNKLTHHDLFKIADTMTTAHELLVTSVQPIQEEQALPDPARLTDTARNLADHCELLYRVLEARIEQTDAAESST